MDINHIIAENLKKLRTERNLSLGQLSTQSEVSKVMLSQIEKGETNPTINTVWKIANGLKVPYTTLLEQQKQEACIIRKSEITVQRDENDHYRLYCYYPTTPQRNFEYFQIELDIGYTHTSIGHSEKSQEYIMVLEGVLTLTVNHQLYELQKNDCISFLATSEHCYSSTGIEPLKAALTIYYPV